MKDPSLGKAHELQSLGSGTLGSAGISQNSFPGKSTIHPDSNWSDDREIELSAPPAEKPTPLVKRSSLATAEKNSHSSFELIAVILFYAGVSLTIVYFNWWLFTQEFEFPVFVSWLQQVIGVLLFLVFATLGRWFSSLSRFPLIVPNLHTAIRVLPLSINFVLMVAFANICLKSVQVSTYQVARSLTIFFTIVLSYAILGQKQNALVLGSCAVMIIGFVIGSLDPSTLSLSGVITGACSSVFQAMYNVVIKTTLTHVDGDTNVMLFYNQLISSVLFIPVVYFSGELPGIAEKLPLSTSAPGFYLIWFSLAVSGLLAVLINLASYLCVKLTSPLTFNIVGFTKSLLQSLGGVLFLGDLVSPQSLGGITLSLFGSAWYSHIKVSESRHAVSASKQLDEELDAFVVETSLKRGGSDGDERSVRVVVSANPLMTGGGGGKPPTESHVEMWGEDLEKGVDNGSARASILARKHNSDRP